MSRVLSLLTTQSQKAVKEIIVYWRGQLRQSAKQFEKWNLLNSFLKAPSLSRYLLYYILYFLPAVVQQKFMVGSGKIFLWRFGETRHSPSIFEENNQALLFCTFSFCTLFSSQNQLGHFILKSTLNSSYELCIPLFCVNFYFFKFMRYSCLAKMMAFFLYIAGYPMVTQKPTP